MSQESQNPPASTGGAEVERKQGLWAGLIMQQANLALMSLGVLPGADGQKPARDLEMARMFIDILELLQEKTEGNLDAGERELLKDTLTNLRMGFVQAVNRGEEKPSSSTGGEASAAGGPASATASAPSSAPPGTDDEESRKRFTKKY